MMMEYCHWLITFTLITHYIKVTRTTTCGCDLFAYGCDMNCCCDPDCSAEDKKIFSTCITINKAHVEEICVSDSLLFSANGKYQIEGNGGGLLCLYKNNYNARFFYSDVSAVTNQLSFERLASKYRKTSYREEETKKVSYENSFKFEDPLFIVISASQQRGFLPQPVSFLTSECEDSNPARFLLPQQSDCIRVVKNLREECTMEQSWNASSFVYGYTVAPYPSFIFEEQTDIQVQMINKSQSITATRNDSQLIQPQLISLKCRDAHGVEQPCPFTKPHSPSFNETTNTCSNVVQEVQFKILYANDVTVKITQVNVSLILGDISTSFRQQYNFEFAVEENSTTNVTNKSMTYMRSGNPGYIIGLPVIVAVVEGEGDAAIVYPSTTNMTVRFSTMKSTSSGKCNEDADPLYFGIDLRTGCFKPVPNIMTLAECKQLQIEIYNILLFKLPTHVAVFGNPHAKKLSDWIPIINVHPKIEPTMSNGHCFNIHTSVLFEVIFANTGFQQNPQRKIVGFNVKYGEARNLYSTCFGLFCDSSSTKTKTGRIEIIQSAAFIDASLTPQAEVKLKPQFKSKAPNDFFYPFDI